MGLELPYFDDILAKLERSSNTSYAQAFARHVHWGYFSSPENADGSDEGYASAAEAMTEQMCLTGRVKDGQRILDVGCGFGGTIAHLNERLSGCRLVGLNIDERQLARARQSVQPRASNEVTFVQGDACALPFGDSEFDTVLAVECIFHFPSRRSFFGEARRVLRRGGTLALSDFVIDATKADEMAAWTAEHPDAQGGIFGSTSAALVSGTYERLGRARGLTPLDDRDVTPETMPTYPWWKRLYEDAGLPEGVKTIVFLEEMARRGFFQYRLLSFEAASD
jgi:SAM-dependent methyltransferase